MGPSKNDQECLVTIENIFKEETAFEAAFGPFFQEVCNVRKQKFDFVLCMQNYF